MVRQRQSEPVVVYQMKVSLMDVEPAIWRRFQVTSDRTLYRLHLILQTVMGWEDYHLYRFTIDDTWFGEPDEEYEPDIKHARRIKLDKVVHTENQRIFYTYDYGDSWEHEILVEKIMPGRPDAQYPICLEGERACPPEDCGGAPGYSRLLAIIQNPQHDEYEHTVSWLADRFDSEEFDVLAINQELRHYHQQGWRLPMQLYPQKEATHPPPVMQSVNRLVAIIKPREPFLRWLESQPDWDLDMTLEELRTDCTALLIPEFDDNEQARNYIEANCRIVFEMQLNGWYTDPAMWPKKRNLNTFRQWFDVEIHSTAVDTLNEGIRKDAY